MKKILLTGATGYIGRRLKNVLLQEQGIKLRLLVRNSQKVPESIQKQVETVEGNTFDKKSLAEATKEIDVAFYLIHSMGSEKDFADMDRVSAQNFRDACINAGVKKIVYLGGLGDKKTASKHLLSRIETGEVLSACPNKITTIWFRAGVIIGSGSASFEMLRNLVQKLPVMVTPSWITTQTQPIAVDDIISYLQTAINLNVKENIVVDIGSEQMSFKVMLEKTAAAMGLKRIIIPLPLLTPRLSSYWLVLITPVPYKVAAALVEGLKSETIRQNDNAEKYFPKIKPIPFEDAIKRAICDIENNQVISRWCDSSAGEVCDVKYQDDTSSAVYRDIRRVDFGEIDPAKVFTVFTSIGGENGWFHYNFLWQLRGWIDKALGGYGLNRGKRCCKVLRIGDAIDFWKVVDIRSNKRLLLFSQMHLPGKAWLEFDIEGHTLVQTAYFYPNGIWGRIYWYQFVPFHLLIFEKLAKSIVERAKDLASNKLD